MEQATSLTWCRICGHPVRFEECKTDEQGLAVHEQCYTIKVTLKSESPSARTAIGSFLMKLEKFVTET